MKVQWILATLLLGGCPGGDDKGGGGGGGGGSNTILGPDDVVLNDTDAGLEVSIEGGTAANWKLGVVWAAQGYEEEACDGGDSVCHPLDASGGTLDWCSQHEGSEGCTGIPQLYYRQGQVSLMLKPKSGVGCWSWGDEADYWDGCEEMGWDPSSY